MAKRVVRKSASKTSPRPEKSLSGKRRHPDALESPEGNDEQRANPKVQVKAQRVAKVVNLIVSVGDDDRGRSFEKFLEDIKKQMGAIEPPFMDEEGKRKPGPHVAMTGGYYILDGKVCLPDDYDPKKQAFKIGATPPEWAGGMKTKEQHVGVAQRQMDWDLENLSSDEYDKKYRIGKYAPKQETEAEHVARMKKQREALLPKPKATEEDEDFDWGEEDVLDDEKMGAVADASASEAVKKLKGKRVVKKKPAPTKKVVRRVKK